MKIDQANKILAVLDRLNAEFELLGKMLLRQNAKPVVVPIRVNEKFKPHK